MRSLPNALPTAKNTGHLAEIHSFSVTLVCIFAHVYYKATNSVFLVIFGSLWLSQTRQSFAPQTRQTLVWVLLENEAINSLTFPRRWNTTWTDWCFLALRFSNVQKQVICGHRPQ